MVTGAMADNSAKDPLGTGWVLPKQVGHMQTLTDKSKCSTSSAWRAEPTYFVVLFVLLSHSTVVSSLRTVVND